MANFLLGESSPVVISPPSGWLQAGISNSCCMFADPVFSGLMEGAALLELHNDMMKDGIQRERPEHKALQNISSLQQRQEEDKNS